MSKLYYLMKSNNGNKMHKIVIEDGYRFLAISQLITVLITKIPALGCF